MESLVRTLDASEHAEAPRYSPGDVVDGVYRLIELLGEGGTAWVWRARCDPLAIDVAVKLLKPAPVEEGEEVDPRAAIAEARLLAEAKIAAAIGHPSIVSVFDVGTTALGDPYLVMELLRGDPLASLIEVWGKLPERSAVLLVLPLAGALAAAHASGIVHRDVKPDNVIVVPCGSGGERLPKLVDFGIARLVTEAGARLTVAGTLIGSPGYMAPEQVRGDPDVDARADVWGLSVVLYEIVTGRRPFVGRSISAVLLSLLHDRPRPTTEKGGDPVLWEILKRGLAKDREDRWPEMRDLGRALAAWAWARGARIDVTGAPLDPWLEEGAAEAAGGGEGETSKATVRDSDSPDIEFSYIESTDIESPDIESAKDEPGAAAAAPAVVSPAIAARETAAPGIAPAEILPAGSVPAVARSARISRRARVAIVLLAIGALALGWYGARHFATPMRPSAAQQKTL